MTTPITVKNEVGREQNPNYLFKDTDIEEENLHEAVSNLRYNKFEQSVKSYPCPGIPDTKEGEFVEAELVWQCTYNWDLSKWYDVSNEWYEDMENATANKYRQIYRLPQQPKEQEKEKTAEDEYHVCHDCQLAWLLNCSEFDKCGSDKSYPRELRKLVERDYNNKIPVSITVERGYDMGKSSQSTRISELEARVKELEGALVEIASYTYPYSSIGKAVTIATNALKTDK